MPLDFSNTEVAATQYEWSITGEWGDNTNLSTHPTPEGNEYMARQILTQLPEQQPVEDVLSKTDICVDLGRFKNVKSVVLDGKTVTGYSTDGYKLIVKNDSKDALLLTVTVTDENNVTNVLVYQLTYHDGYTAYRVYGVSATKVRSVVSARVTSIKDTVMSLFKK